MTSLFRFCGNTLRESKQSADKSAHSIKFYKESRVMPQVKSILVSYLRKSAFICGCFVVFLLCAAPAFAQNGGKAEPLKIEFKRGTTSTTINGVVRGDEEAEYTLTARQGQQLTIKLTSTPVKSSCFDLKGPDGVNPGLKYDCNYDYSKPLPATGEYFLKVSRPTTVKGTARYKMTITIR